MIVMKKTEKKVPIMKFEKINFIWTGDTDG